MMLTLITTDEEPPSFSSFMRSQPLGKVPTQRVSVTLLLRQNKKHSYLENYVKIKQLHVLKVLVYIYICFIIHTNSKYKIRDPPLDGAYKVCPPPPPT